MTMQHRLLAYLADRPQGATGSEILAALGISRRQGSRAWFELKQRGALLAKDDPALDGNRQQRFWHTDHRAGWEAYKTVYRAKPSGQKTKHAPSDAPVVNRGVQPTICKPFRDDRFTFTPPPGWVGEISRLRGGRS